MMKTLRKIGLLVALLFVAQVTWAVSSPVSLLQGVANNLTRGLQKNQSQLKSNPAIVRNLVKKYLVPHVAVSYMSGSVVGRDWRSATTAQRTQFKHRFTHLVISTYSEVLQSYNGDVVKFYPIRGGFANKQALEVRSVIQRSNGQNIAVNYYVMRVKNTWEIYDFAIEGVSMVQNYHAQFAGTLAQGGLKLLLSRMASRG
jgi:phospholipid transport system substrate-binding protein